MWIGLIISECVLLAGFNVALRAWPIVLFLSFKKALESRVTNGSFPKVLAD
jgi:hypothetical protein